MLEGHNRPPTLNCHILHQLTLPTKDNYLKRLVGGDHVSPEFFKTPSWVLPVQGQALDHGNMLHSPSTKKLSHRKCI